MKILRGIGIAASLTMLIGAALPQDRLGKGKNPPSRSGGGSEQNAPPSRPPVSPGRGGEKSPPGGRADQGPPSRPPVSPPLGGGEKSPPGGRPDQGPPSRPPVSPPLGGGEMDKGRPRSGGGTTPPRNDGGLPTPPDQSRPPVGRIELPERGGRTQVADQDLIQRRGNSSGSNHNLASSRERPAPVTIGKAPVDLFAGTLGNQVLREERIRIIPNVRRFYVHYDPFWCDDYFRFKWYVYDCYAPVRIYCSPWYYYPHLPAYLDTSCVTILRISLGPMTWYSYTWRRPMYTSYYGGGRYDYSTSRLDYAIADLVDAFEEGDRRALDRVVPRYGNVHVWVDGRYVYSMQSNRFYDLMLDNVYSTRTRRYEIVRVRTYRDEAEVLARHEYISPWGSRESVYHWYRLENDGGEYVIRHFGTSNYRAW